MASLTLKNQWQLAPDTDINVKSSEISTATTSSPYGGPRLKLTITEVDENGSSKTLRWKIEYLTDRKIETNPESYVFYTLTYSDPNGNVKDKSIVSEAFYMAKDKYPPGEWHDVNEDTITFEKAKSARQTSFKLELNWHNTKYLDGTYKPVDNNVKTIEISNATTKILAKVGNSANTGDGGGGNPSSTDTSENAIFPAEWSTAVVFDIDGYAATTTPPAPEIEVEDDGDGSEPTLIIKVDKSKVFDSLFQVNLVFEVVEDDITLVYSGDDIIVRSDEDLNLTPYTEARVKVKLGCRYNARCRTIKKVGDKSYESEWSAWSNTAQTAPTAPEAITKIQAASSNGKDVDSIYLEWTASTTAKTYDIQYSLNKEFNDNSNDDAPIVEKVNGTKYTLIGFGEDGKSGEEWFVRVRSVGEGDIASDWSNAASVIVGTAPAAPTTWSSASVITVGEPINLYWVHNSMDGSAETCADLNVYIDRAIRFVRGSEVHRGYFYTNAVDRYECIKDGLPETIEDPEYFVKVSASKGVRNIPIPLVYKTVRFIGGMEVFEGRYYTDGTDKYLCRQNGFSSSLYDPDWFTKVTGGYDENEASCYRLETGATAFEGDYYASGSDVYMCIKTGVPGSLDDAAYFRKVAVEVYTVNAEVVRDNYYTDGRTIFLCTKSGIPESLGDEKYFSEVRTLTFKPGKKVFEEGGKLKWEVRTAGITNMFGPVSERREIDVYSPPTIDFTVTNYRGERFDTLSSLPIHVKVVTGPASQTPIGYYLSITAKGSYTTRDAIGNPKVVHDGDLVYYKYFDITTPLDTSLSAGDVTLENNIEYEISCIASMNSGLMAEASAKFTVGWSVEQHIPTASVYVNRTAYATAIKPYCEEIRTVWHMVNKEDDGRYTVGHAVREEVSDMQPLVKSVESLGKNLLDIVTATEERNCEASAMNGVLSIKRTENGVAYARLMPMYLTGGTKYVLSYTSSTPSTTVYWFDMDGDTALSNMKTFTPSESGYYCVAFGHSGAVDSTITINKAQVEAGSKATSYEDYQGVNVVREKTTTGVDIYVSEGNYYCPLKETKLVEDVVLSVYRREYDGSFTEIAKNVPNQNVYIPDPHPSLDYARYRIVATSKSTGYVSYYDLPNQRIGCKSVIIQWDEEWNYYDADKGRTAEPTWTGSLLDLPYNISVSDKREIEVEMVKYIGRKHPVSYYGTHLGETASWSCEIPKTDKETLYALRRLATWAGDVYVREPSGVGYWAHIVVNFSQKHLELTIPVSFEITRVEGGM